MYIITEVRSTLGGLPQRRREPILLLGGRDDGGGGERVQVCVRAASCSGGLGLRQSSERSEAGRADSRERWLDR